MIDSALLNCSACQCLLVEPVTLSCGNTVCLKCFKANESRMSSAFVCPVLGCTQEKHLFGPTLEKDVTVEALTSKEVINNSNDDSTLDFIVNNLRCPMCTNIMVNPITTYCGHTFCKACLLKDKLISESCKKCLRRLPPFQFIQKQPANAILSRFIRVLSEYQANIGPIAPPMADVSFVNSNCISYSNIPVYLSNFNVLPSQKLRIPMTSQYARNLLHQCVLNCSQLQSICIAMIHKEVVNNNSPFGTIVKITAVEQRKESVLIHVTGLDRFRVQNILNQTDGCIRANVNMVFESSEDLGMAGTEPNLHWSEFTAGNSIYHDISETNVTKLSRRVYDFISGLAHSTPSNSFCNAVEGLLGPVWLNSVQALNGTIPSPENPVAMCWWAGIVFPISDSDRYSLLKAQPLEERLALILSWIGDLESQRGVKPTPVANPIPNVLQ